MKPSSYLLVVIIVVSAIFGGVSLGYSSLKMKLLPLIVSSLIIILAVVELGKEWFAKKSASGEVAKACEGGQQAAVNEEVGLENRGDIRGDMIGFAWLMGMIVGTYLVGFLVSIPLFMIAYLINHRIHWVKSVSMAAVTVALIYFIFVKVLQVELFQGIILDLFL